MSQRAKKENRLQKAGYITKKGQFGAIRSMIGGGNLYIFIYNDEKLTEPNNFLNCLLKNLGGGSKVFSESLRERDKMKSILEKAPFFKFNKRRSENNGLSIRKTELETHLTEINTMFSNMIFDMNISNMIFDMKTLKSYKITSAPTSYGSKEYSRFRTFNVKAGESNSIITKDKDRMLYIHIAEYRHIPGNITNYRVDIKNKDDTEIDEYKEKLDSLVDSNSDHPRRNYRFKPSVWLDVDVDDIHTLTEQIRDYLSLCEIQLIEITKTNSNESNLSFNIRIEEDEEQRILNLTKIHHGPRGPNGGIALGLGSNPFLG
jgi:hypothetical protein